MDESEIVVKLAMAMADGEVVWCHGCGLFHLYFFVKMGWREPLVCRMAYRVAPSSVFIVISGYWANLGIHFCGPKTSKC